MGWNAAQINAYGLPDMSGTDVETPYLIGHYEQGQKGSSSYRCRGLPGRNDVDREVRFVEGASKGDAIA